MNPKSPCHLVGGLHQRGFNLVELLVVVTLVAAAAALWWPALNRARLRVGGVHCLNNCKQLINGYLMYAQDNEDYALNAFGPSANGVPGWCRGFLYSVPQAIDETLIIQSPTYPYVQSVEAFRCPLDQSMFLFRGQLKPRTRSYSVNAFMGYPSPFVRPNCPPYRSIIKMSEIPEPGPSSIYVLIEEHMNSINDSHFLPFRELRGFYGQRWLCAPSGRHQNAAGMAFADGHAKIHKWKDSDVTLEMGPPPRSSIGALPRPGPRDFEWFTNHIALFE